MQSKSGEAYTSMFSCIRQLGFRGTLFCLDMEYTAYCAYIQVFGDDPGFKVLLCYFHMVRANIINTRQKLRCARRKAPAEQVRHEDVKIRSV